MKRWLILFSICWLALQPMLVSADGHRLHQSDSQHSQLQHDPHIDAEDLNFGMGEFAADSHTDGGQLDCHHCCHCHGGGTTSLFVTFYNVDDITPLKHTTNTIYISSFYELDLSLLLRPPIAA